jgi:hypothetical protein
MGSRWVAGSVRARSLVRRRLGAAGIQAVGACPSLDDALAHLEGSAYGRDVRLGQPLAEAQRSVSTTALWHVRVLAGWLPGGGAEITRVMAGPWEIANVSTLLGAIERGSPAALLDLGALGTIGPHLAEARSPRDVRAALARSPWGDPRTSDGAHIVSWLRMRWAERLAKGVPHASRWATGLLAIQLARELFVEGRRPGREWPTSRLGAGWERATSIGELATRLPADGRWSLEGIDDVADLWRAEARWWAAIERAALEQLARFRPGRSADVVACIALLGVDAWRVRGALALAARGGRTIEAFDALD